MVYDRNNNEDEEVVTDEEIPLDDVEIDEAEGTLKDKISTLRAKLRACEEEKRGHLEELQRARADFLNGRKRLEEQLALDKERATDKLLIELLTLVDSFDTATADKALWDSIDERWRTGVEAIQTNLLSILKKHSIEAVDPIGLPFTPEEHEAVSNRVVKKDAEVDTVVGVLQKGFRRNGRIVRPARVVVGTK